MTAGVHTPYVTYQYTQEDYKTIDITPPVITTDYTQNTAATNLLNTLFFSVGDNINNGWTSTPGLADVMVGWRYSSMLSGVASGSGFVQRITYDSNGYTFMISGTSVYGAIYQFFDGTYDSTLQDYYDMGYTPRNALTINNEVHSVYVTDNDGWELNNFVNGKNSGATIGRRARISKRGWVAFTHYNSKTTINNGGSTSMPQYPPSLTSEPTPPPAELRHNSIAFINSRSLGITIGNSGIYEIRVVRQIRDIYQTLQQNYDGGIIANFPSPVPYKTHIYVCIFKTGTTTTSIKAYFESPTNLTLLRDGIFPTNSNFKYAPAVGNYCQTYLETGDIVCVYTSKVLSEVKFSGNWLNAGYYTPILNNPGDQIIAGGESFTIYQTQVGTGTITWPSNPASGVTLQIYDDTYAIFLVDNAYIAKESITITATNTLGGYDSVTFNLTVYIDPILSSHADVSLVGGGSFIIYQTVSDGTGLIIWTSDPLAGVTLDSYDNLHAIYNVANIAILNQYITITAINPVSHQGSVSFYLTNTTGSNPSSGTSSSFGNLTNQSYGFGNLTNQTYGFTNT
jgi:hypothetical protein